MIESKKCKCCGVITEEHKLVACSVCKQLFKHLCVDLTSSDVRIINSKKSLTWSCSTCEDVGSNITKLRSAVVDLQKELIEMKTKFASASTTVSDVYLSTSAFEDVVHEINQRQIRKNNIILYGLKENESNLPDNELNENQTVLNIIYYLSPNINTAGLKMYRLGKYDETKRYAGEITDSEHRTKAATEKLPALVCYRCSTMNDEKCLDLHENSTSLHANCTDDSRICQVKRISLTTITKTGDMTGKPKLWLLERDCSGTCDPGCIIIGERTKLYSCTTCCEESYCNYGLSDINNVLPGIDLSHASDFEIVYPRISDAVVRRRRRDINSNIYFEEANAMRIVELGGWVVELGNTNLLLAPDLKIEWISKNSTTKQPVKQCDYKHGFVRGVTYSIEPIELKSNSHIIYKNKILKSSNKRKRSLVTVGEFNSSIHKWEYFNLTGDTIEIDGSGFDESNETDSYEERLDKNFFAKNKTTTWLREEENSDDSGYFFDSAWVAKEQSSRKITPHTIQPTRWLEIAMSVDHTVIGFHGSQRVEQYVIALMNIVSAIYQDASLEANLQLVITRLFFYQNVKQSVVRPGNARKSLENVNLWNKRLHMSLAPGERPHDVAIWLTRADIGGPSGYAPVGGVCDSKRSCALNRDEGLSSAFIVAHEMGHLLGLSHDGDHKSNNFCDDAPLDGSVMAPMVSATFHKFLWSECSREEYKLKESAWQCIDNGRPGPGRVLDATIHATFTMDEQCRMEFGEGFQVCRSFDIIEPCSHLWCGHEKSPFVCKTKKGSPLEGTECGFDKWCINGYCEPVDNRKFGVTPVLHNPQDGGWSNWRDWGVCSRSCGIGVRFRSRTCDNPPPLYGGNNCYGAAEEWKLCNVNACPDPIADLRAQQCQNIIGFLKIQDRRGNMTWLPYESDDAEMKCQLICMSKETRELFVTGENLIDGTPCSYENSSDICIQGNCQPLGCDGKLFSKAQQDACGVCEGNNSDCSIISSIYQKKIKKEVSRIAVVPRNARNIRLDANVTLPFGNNPTATFILKNRMNKKYFIPIPSKIGHSEIIEGTKLYYQKTKGKHALWAKGPFLIEMVFLLYAPKSEVSMGLNVSITSQYFIQQGMIDSSSRFHWIQGGWGPCSASCGGGRRQKTIACWDDKNKKIVRRKFCSLILKPNVPSEICNTFSCNFHWITGEWEPCTVTCGSYGKQHRELYCVPKSAITNNANNTSFEKPWRFMVTPTKCAGIRPISVRPCYRIPCPSFWEYGNWSQCSSSCGSGVSTRSTHCPPPEGEQFFTCGTHPPMQRKVCRGPFTGRTNSLCKNKNKKKCLEDKSEYCILPSLAKYCKLCRYRDEGLMPDNWWKHKTGAECYKFCPPEWFTQRIRISTQWINNPEYSCKIPIGNVNNGTFITFNYEDENSTGYIASSFKEILYFTKWKNCAENADTCCQAIMNDVNIYPSDEYQCPATWDAWSCFDSAASGTVSELPCPDYTTSSQALPCTLYSKKRCFANETWEVTTNYSTCSSAPVYRRRHYFHLVVLYVSTALSLPAVLIFVTYKKLRILRVNLHRNLLIACILRNICTILTKDLVLLDSLKNSTETNYVMISNGVPCRVLAYFNNAFTNAVYACMLIDGYYLHKLIVNVFNSDPNIYLLHTITIVLSFLPTTIWAILMAVNLNNNCWTVDTSWYHWITDAFRIGVLCLNVLLLLNIVRVLLKKLKRNVTAKETKSTLKATLFLLPLFGVPFILIANRNIIDEKSCTAGDIYYYVSYSIQALQSVMVALLFCYLNKEVHTQIKKTYKTILIERFGVNVNSANRRRDTAATYVHNQAVSQVEARRSETKAKVKDWLTENPVGDDIQKDSKEDGQFNEISRYIDESTNRSHENVEMDVFNRDVEMIKT
ncbi:hypothetical protein FQR65_LT08202 [Abscondita terminalis]|nr:hypothetical protein FQR65_LT08202 [Abscondita terminalis]